MKSETDELDPQTFMADFIGRNLDELADNWLRIVRNHPLTRSYRALDKEKARQVATTVYDQLQRWLAGGFTKGDIESSFTALGARRRAEGYGLSEVIRALTVTRRVLWFKVQSEGLLDQILEAEMALAVSNRVVLFFDRAIFFTTVGYERQ